MFKTLFRRKTNPEIPACVSRGGPQRRSLSSRTSVFSNGPLQISGPVEGFRYNGNNRADFYRYMRNRIPIISAGIWTWVHLCSTPQQRISIGNTGEVNSADRILDKLDHRIYPRQDGDCHGLKRIVASFFLELFTLGSFAAIVKILPDGSGLSHIEILDPYRVHWKEGEDGIQRPWLETEPGEYEAINPETFFHRTLSSDYFAPGGVEPLASIPFVVEIEQRMLEDMARASHNAGTPRLQVRITPPEPAPGEDAETYSNRANNYFERTVSQFDELGPDDNLFTWDDVEVRVVGGSSETRAIWKLNREQVIEDVITGLKLFPWALGRSHGTTKNWIFAQYNLLMQIVDSVQLLGKDLAEWLMRLELRLAGNMATPTWEFAPNQDPFVVERNRARLMQFERIDRMVERGYISKDQGARELGYPGASSSDNKNSDNKKTEE